ncbi:MarR family winged helix-turn-helix transcriptional regulator [Hirschia maritima]|uniref:MarR family winged helix-turn-helix transcriptional regulator n=1 Tax=Hirschia maritima TaxID=1121961 RepID=UPI00037F7F0A|nr:MarR family winged helix-turn-helix transcriptional regulator [Hirschia maritima]
MELDRTAALQLWRDVLANSVRSDAPDLSARQMAILMAVYLTPPPHTVRGLALSLDLGKPAVTRALDTLSNLKLLKRRKDPDDLRNVLVQRTVAGSVFLTEFGDTICDASKIIEAKLPETAKKVA